MRNIYKKAFQPKKAAKVQTASVDVPITVQVPIQKVEVPVLKEKLQAYPEVQKVKVLNLPKDKEVQKVEVINQTETEKVDLEKVETLLTELVNKEAPKFPEKIKAEVINPTEKLDIPIGRGDIPGQADPERYVPVRLSDGKKFYEAQKDAFVAASKAVFPFVDVNGKPKQVQLDESGNLPTAASASITTTSGSPLYTYSVNEPTVRQVYVVNPSSASVTTSSGSPLDVAVRNFPTVMSVNVLSQPAGGNNVSVTNFPALTVISGTVSQVNNGVTTAVSGTMTTLSGSAMDIKNFPTVQTVSVQNLPSIAGNVTTLSGSSTDVKNFPTVQTVNVQNLPNVNITTTSGSPLFVNDIARPTTQDVSVKNLPSINGSVTTLSGSSTNVANFPTYQTVNVQNLPNITTTSGSIVDVKNFPTIQTVQVQGVTTISGSQDNVTSSVLPGFNINPYDYIAYSSTSTQDIYSYKKGGSGGTLLATVTVNWTDSTKTTLVSVAKT